MLLRLKTGLRVHENFKSMPFVDGLEGQAKSNIQLLQLAPVKFVLNAFYLILL